MKVEQVLIGIITTIILGISSWSLVKLIDMSVAVARLEANLSNVSARIADIEK